MMSKRGKKEANAEHGHEISSKGIIKSLGLVFGDIKRVGGSGMLGCNAFLLIQIIADYIINPRNGKHGLHCKMACWLTEVCSVGDDG